MAEDRDFDEVDSDEAAYRPPHAADPPASSLATAVEATGDAIAGCALAELPQALVARLAESALLHGVGLWLLDPSDDTLRRRAWAGRLELPSTARHAVALRGSALGAIARAPRPSQVPASAVTAEALACLTPEDRERAMFVGFPLVRGDLLLGVLGLVAPQRLDDAGMALVGALARHVAAELAVARLQSGSTVRPQPGFIALLGHELRTPLTGLRGNVQLAAIGVQKGDYRRVGDRLAAALRLVDTMTLLLQNLQDMSRIERGVFALTLAPGELTEAVQAAARRAERTITSGRYTIAVHAAEPLPLVHDARQMEQVFYNLITNALTYSPDGGTVEVRAERDDRGAVVSISDEGIGIPPEEQERIFAPYYRGSRAREASAKGLGVGLAVSREVVALHGGSIAVRSGPTGGSTFTVRLPSALAADD